jgi:hypothetical protein
MWLVVCGQQVWRSSGEQGEARGDWRRLRYKTTLGTERQVMGVVGNISVFHAGLGSCECEEGWLLDHLC